MNETDWIRRGPVIENPKGGKSKYVVERIFEQTVAGPNGCVIFTGAKVGRGYGSVRTTGQRRARAHRVICESYYGMMTKDDHACHRCDNPPCVNPLHLFVGTVEDNVRDRQNKKRHVHGTRHWKAKLTPEKVEEIKRMVASGSSIAAAARKMGVTTTCAWQALRGKNWAHLMEGAQ